jgi:hypothetical protein
VKITTGTLFEMDGSEVKDAVFSADRRGDGSVVFRIYEGGSQDDQAVVVEIAIKQVDVEFIANQLMYEDSETV